MPRWAKTSVRERVTRFVVSMVQWDRVADVKMYLEDRSATKDTCIGVSEEKGGCSVTNQVYLKHLGGRENVPH